MVCGKAEEQSDKVFVATGHSIKGLNKKGKEFFRFNTNLTEVRRCKLTPIGLTPR